MRHSLVVFEEIYLPNITYKKCGIVLCDLVDKHDIIRDLFDSRDVDKHRQLMKAMDLLNDRMGKNTVTLAVANGYGEWMAKRDNKSHCYTTRWDELPIVH